MTVGERIRELRKRLNMSQVEFADKINVSKQTLYKYENNIITNIPSDKIEAAAKLGNVSPSQLMGWPTPIDYLFTLDSGEKIIIECYRKLPSESKKRVEQYISMLSKLQLLEEPILNAAHAEESASEEDKKHDEDIMDSEDF